MQSIRTYIMCIRHFFRRLVLLRSVSTRCYLNPSLVMTLFEASVVRETRINFVTKSFYFIELRAKRPSKMLLYIS